MPSRANRPRTRFEQIRTYILCDTQRSYLISLIAQSLDPRISRRARVLDSIPVSKSRKWALQIFDRGLLRLFFVASRATEKSALRWWMKISNQSVDERQRERCTQKLRAAKAPTLHTPIRSVLCRLPIERYPLHRIGNSRVYFSCSFSKWTVFSGVSEVSKVVVMISEAGAILFITEFVIC